MRLRDLDLHGYKTFASRTSFVFDGRITAIVGPNGSGKSNIADAIRWVLGEQSYRALRGKRTEDMIFSGSVQRARLGMASASLTFDNADGWLPIDFSEVRLARRAYRSGENEYLINGHRVRLGDISELLSKSGLAQRTYTVIGQGVVDAVLSLRSEDRRALFEEAAGIAVYRAKRSDAEGRLDETRANLLRVGDIVHEIAPRLHRLERDAERARLHAILSQQLETMLRTWYGYRWHRMQLDLRRLRDAEVRREARATRHREALQAVQARIAASRQQQAEIRDQLGGWHREGSELHRQMEQVHRSLAVLQERARLLSLQGDEIAHELADLQIQAQTMAGQVSTAEEALAASEEALRLKESAAHAARQELDNHEARRDALASTLAEAQSRVVDLATQMADRRSRLAQLEEQRADRARQRRDHGAVLATLEAGLAETGAQTDLQLAEQRHLMALAEDRAAEAARLTALRADARARQEDLRSSLSSAQLGAEQLQARQQWLMRMRDEGEGLPAGVRAVLQRARGSEGARRLAGIVGTVAELIQVAVEHEAAIEAALGGRLQEVVVQSWPDAEAAIALLREEKLGRATFLPLDTIRPGPRLEAPHARGVVGIAADLVQCDARLNRVVELLLGRTLVAQDLKAARRLFDGLQGGFQIVTLDGEILRSSGSVTGGQAAGQERGRWLAREREWRELPARIEAAQRKSAQIEADLVEARASEQRAGQQTSAVAADHRAVAAHLAQVEAELRRLRLDADRFGQQIAWRKEMLAQLDGRDVEHKGLESAVHRELEALSRDRQAAEGEGAALEAALSGMRAESLYQVLSEARTAAAVARRSWEHHRSTLEGVRERASALQAQLGLKRDRAAGLSREQASLAGQIESLASREAVVQGWLSALAQKIEPSEAELSRLEAERERLAGEEAGQRARLREAEDSHAQAVLARSREEDRRQRLRRQILDDFGLVEMEPMDGQPDQQPLPLAEMVSSLPVVDNLPTGLEEEIQQLRAQIRRMGPVHPGVLDEYAEVKDRYTFLTTQAADLEEATRRLREVILELDEVMRREFAKTFEAVAAHFQANFAQLFGGGTARLTLTEPEDLTATGVEIVARPPGKRQQGLALLSGGERALTAVALMFSFLQVNPPPFCILDEVDAMLDEANVLRFRQMLELLSQHTQFIVITHNRTTVGAADTVYGVSMGDDSVSQVVSLRLEGDRVLTPSGALVTLGAGG